MRRCLQLQIWLFCSAASWSAAWLACHTKDDTTLVPAGEGGFAGALGAAHAGAGDSAGTGGRGGAAGAGNTADAGRDAAASGGSAGQGNPAQLAEAGPLDCGGTPFALFGEARAVCGDGCRICPVDVVGDRLVGYFMIPNGLCECSPPAPLLAPDAGTSGPPAGCLARGNYLTSAQAEASCGADPGACRVCLQNGSSPDAALAWSVVRAECDCPEPESDMCGSHAGLSEADATSICAGLLDCHVCVQQTDGSGAPALWAAHACGCPAPFSSAH